MVGDTSIVYVLFIKINKKLKSNLKIVSFPNWSFNSVVQWVRGFFMSLQVMSSNHAVDFKIFTFSKKYFFVKYFEISSESILILMNFHPDKL